MTSVHSASELNPPTVGAAPFDLLHPKVQRWVWQQGWTDLHEVQERAIAPIAAREHDVLIGAATAAGKTEAAFLPICSRLVTDDVVAAGIAVLYLGPLKALINDQFRRVDDLCEGLGIRTHRWHGDVAASKKTALLKDPSGILLTTPESLEAMFVRRGTSIRTLFGAVRYVVIDELHSFLGVERGTQLISLLHRLEIAIGTRIPRIGLSATLGDMSIAAEQLRPGEGRHVIVISSPSGGQELRLQLRGYPHQHPANADDLDIEGGTAIQQIADHLYRTLRGSTNLAFANSRDRVEELASRLAELAERANVPNEFQPHHGNLSKELREDVESLLRDPSRPATAVCTSTLEMGIDIGDIAQVAQIGPPPSVAALRQRVGRSGRRDTPAVLRAYIELDEIDAHSPPIDRLHPDLIQTIAAIELLREQWCEPPVPTRLDLSTLIQQLLSLIAQCGGARPEQAYHVLCGPGGPFSSVTQQQFALLLRDLAARQVLIQSADRTLLAGPVGDREVNHYTFYAAFRTPEEYRLVHGDTTLGTYPVVMPLQEHQLMVFAGRRWRVLAVHDQDKVIQLVPATGGKPSLGGLKSGLVHATVRGRMRTILSDATDFVYLDPVARTALYQARHGYAELRLDEQSLIRDGKDTLVFAWTGDRELGTLAQILTADGLEAAQENLALRITDAQPGKVRDVLRAIVGAPPPTELDLARHVLNKLTAKYDSWLGEELLSSQYATNRLDCPAALRTAAAVLATAGP